MGYCKYTYTKVIDQLNENYFPCNIIHHMYSYIIGTVISPLKPMEVKTSLILKVKVHEKIVHHFGWPKILHKMLACSIP